MRYVDAVAAAPPGSDRFGPADVAQLSRTALRLLLEPGPAAPPLEDVAAALGADPATLYRVATALPSARGERLLRLAQRPVASGARDEAGRRLVRGTFWTLVYELAPDRWAALADAEPVAPALIADLPADGVRVIDVAAGAGRLTAALAGRARTLLAIEPSAPLRALLRRRLPGVLVAAGVGHRLPVASGWADLVVSCATLGPHPPLGGDAVVAELERCARPGGAVALVSPEEPAWWEERGYEQRVYESPAMPPAPDLEAFFGPLDPPRRLLVKRVAA